MYEIIVVDDHIREAETFAELIRNRTRLSTVATDNPDLAMQYLREHPIRVALLDQEMPAMLGTELFQALRKVNPSLRGIMLTGEAPGAVVSKALTDLGFSRYLEKADVGSIARAVMLEYVEHQAAAASRTSTEHALLFSTPRKYKLFGPRRTFEILSEITVDETYIPDEAWQTVLQISAGEERVYSEQSSVIEAFTIEKQSQETLKASIGASGPLIAKISSNIEAALNSSYTETTATTATRSMAVQRSYKLPEEPSDSNAVYVKSRQLMQAPIRRRVLVSILSTCQHCNVSSVIPLTMLHFTGAFATKQEDYLSDGTRKSTDTGVIRP